jgi:hypothetical protein
VTGGLGGWQAVTGCANDIAISVNGVVWIASCAPVPNGYAIQKWNGTGWDTILGDRGGISIAVDSLDVPWIVANDGLIFRRTSATAGAGSWQSLPGVGFDIGIGPDDQVWAISAVDNGAGKKIYAWNALPSSNASTIDGDWLPIAGGAVRIAGGALGAWAINGGGGIWRQLGAGRR